MSQKYVAASLAACFLALSILIKVFGEETPINTELFRFADTHHYFLLDGLMVFFSNYGREYVWVPVVFVLWLFGGQYRRCSFLLAATFVAAIVLGAASKAIMAQPRPFEVLADVAVLVPKPADYAYPSGHAVIVGAGALVVLNALPKKYSLPLLVEALVVSYSRMYVGLHWPADVLGGWLLGAFCSYLVLYEEQRLRPIYEFLSDLWDRIVFSLRYRPPEEEEEEG